MAEKTPLEQIQAAAKSRLPLSHTGLTPGELDAFLVQAFDAGVKAARDLDAEVAKLDQQARTERCTCPAKAAGYAHIKDMHTASCALNQD